MRKTKPVVNIFVNQEERRAWNEYATDHDISVAQLIRAYMNGLVTGKVDPPPIIKRLSDAEQGIAA